MACPYMSLRCNSKTLAFTLIEILIVIVIISIVTGIVFLSLTLSGTKAKAKQEANRLEMVIGFAQQQSLLQTAPISLEVLPKKYQFLQFNQDNQWQLMNAGIFAPHQLPYGLTEELKMGDKSQILFSATGSMTPFVIEISGNKQIYYQVTVDASGNTTIQAK
jgi:type II secretion system protein H